MDINATDLTELTSSNIGTDTYFVMFNTIEGKKGGFSALRDCLYADFKTKLTFTDANSDGNIICAISAN